MEEEEKHGNRGTHEVLLFVPEVTSNTLILLKILLPKSDARPKSCYSRYATPFFVSTQGPETLRPADCIEPSP